MDIKDVKQTSALISKAKAVLFDLDGVLVDTEPSYSVFWGGMGSKYNVPVSNFPDVIKGTTLTLILGRYFAPELHKEIVEQLDDYERHMQYRLFDGTEQILGALNAAGTVCAIVTSSNLEKMSSLWKQHPTLRGYFSAVITDEDVTHSKPDPEPYLLAMSRLGVAPADCVVVEDSYNGLLSGRRAGCGVIALATTNPAEELADKADEVFPDISALIDLQQQAPVQ